VHKVINGQLAAPVGWNPDWAGNSAVTVNLTHVPELADKWVRLPSGALNDLLRLVSQGEATISQENVGTFRDSAVVQYDQDRSVHTAYNKGVWQYDPLIGWTFYQQWVTDSDNSPGRWNVYYDRDGTRTFTLTDGFGGSYAQLPVWNGSTTQQVGNDILGRYTQVPNGYYDNTASLGFRATTASFNTLVGWDPLVTYQGLRFEYVNGLWTWHEAFGAANAYGGHLATPLNAAQNENIFNKIPHGNHAWIAGGWWKPSTRLEILLWVSGHYSYSSILLESR